MKLFNLFKKKRTGKMESSTWNTLSEFKDVQAILDKSNERPQLIYKHSTRCSVSFVSKDDLEKYAEQISQKADLNIVYVIQQRNISNAIATEFKIRHESPQAILLKDGEVIWKGSHWDVNAEEILNRLKSVTIEQT
ncbi:MAG: bacillithiol system redox-active protein YtxJ [Balneolaceae bacterium]|nr:bacillithiol system redox-active protein YtxJ [Balneolaceae bacterium]